MSALYISARHSLLTIRRAFGVGEADHAAGKVLLDQLEKKLDVYETILSKQKYIAGDVRLLSLSLYLIAMTYDRHRNSRSRTFFIFRTVLC